jgi:hypothetical protein
MSAGGFEGWASEEIDRFQKGINIRRPSDNQSIFKYIGMNSEYSWKLFEETLSSSYLTGSPVNRLNDPFELAPSIFDDLQPTTVAAAVGYNPLPNRLKHGRDIPLDEVFPDSRPYRVKAGAYLADVNDRYRIVSFCERSDSGLLWAHYANSYKGACLHFLAKGVRVCHGSTMGYVNYSKCPSGKKLNRMNRM